MFHGKGCLAIVAHLSLFCANRGTLILPPAMMFHFCKKWNHYFWLINWFTTFYPKKVGWVALWGGSATTLFQPTFNLDYPLHKKTLPSPNSFLWQNVPRNFSPILILKIPWNILQKHAECSTVFYPNVSRKNSPFSHQPFAAAFLKAPISTLPHHHPALFSALKIKQAILRRFNGLFLTHPNNYPQH